MPAAAMWIGASAAAWVVVAGVSLAAFRWSFWMALIWVAGWVAAAVLAVVAPVVVWRAGRPASALAGVVLSLAAGTAIVRTDWASASVHGFYRWHREDFAAVAALAGDGGLWSTDTYGPLLPEPLRYLSTNGRAARILSVTGGPSRVLFIPQQLGIPDGGAGYVLLGTGRAGETFDCFLDGCRVRWSLGDGWFWAGPL